ncbi:MAG: HAMP domain-containing histidine kinase [Sandaracinus sp.]|nr:HAMP domain-containing histidine kinase [Sandaracinus sp.]MCB9631206.1 HAMP domain-containing histidine kinase [Sandaracinus sp.]
MVSSRLERLLPVATLLAATAWLVGQGLAWVGVERAARTADRGEANLRIDAFLAATSAPPTRAEVESYFEAHRADGLRYLAATSPEGQLEAGEALGPQSGGPMETIDGRVRVTRRLPPPHHGKRPPPGRRRFAPSITVEIEPNVGPQLRADARRSLGLATAAALLALALAFALRRTQRERARLVGRTERDRRLAALGEMSSVLAHELRNPLASLKGHAQLLEETLPEGRPRDKARRVVAEAERLERLSGELLEFVRTGGLSLASCDLRALAEEAAANAAPDAKVEGDALSCDVDRARVRELLVNLLANAHATQTPVTVEVKAEGEHAVVRVRDHGPGIPEGDLDAIFEPFHTTRPRGTGLGLAIARRIAERHRGTLSAANAAGGGALFELRLPRAAVGE